MCKNAFSVKKGVFAIPNIIPYFALPTRQTKTTNKEMENIPVTAYSGFSNVRGEITLRKVIENITKGIHAKLVFKIRLLVRCKGRLSFFKGNEESGIYQC